MIVWNKYKDLSDFVRSHKKYLEVCSECRDELLLYQLYQVEQHLHHRQK